MVIDSFEATTSDQFDDMLTSWQRQLVSAKDGPQRRLEASWCDLVSESFRKSSRGAETFQAWHAIAAQSDGNAYARTIEAMRGFDISERLHELACPVLFLRGELDPMVDNDSNLRMSTKPRNASAGVIAGSKHLPNVDNTAAFNEALLSWLKKFGLTHEPKIL